MADDPFADEFGVSIEQLGFDPRRVESQEDYDALTDARRRLFANIRYESTLPPDQRRAVADKRRQQVARRGGRYTDPCAPAAAPASDGPPRLHLPEQRNIFIPIWEGFDQLCFSTMYDVFKTARCNVVVGVCRPSCVVPPPTADHTARPQVRSKSGVFVSGDFLFDYRGNSNFLDFDAIVVPSGDGVKGTMLSNKKVCSLLKVLAHRGRKLVCAVEDVPGILLLRLGILSKVRCTGSGRSEDEITHSVPPELGRDVEFVKDAAVLVDGHVITARSAADSQECALTVLAVLTGVDAMAEIAKKVGHEELVVKVKKNVAAPTKETVDADKEATEKESVETKEEGGEVVEVKEEDGQKVEVRKVED